MKHTRLHTHSQEPARFAAVLIRLLLALTFATLGEMALAADPSDRVARLSVLSGEIGFAPDGEDAWREASINRPLVAGDRLYTERDARTELDLGTAALRLDERSELRLLKLDDATAQVELPEGTLNLTVRKLYDGQAYEIDTPTLALVIREPGAYRVDARDDSTQVTVFSGDAEVYGAGDAYERVQARRSYRFNDADLRDVDTFDLPRPDDFDDWCFARDERYRDPAARRYVSDEVIGYAELDDYGDWHEASEYGPVWYPRVVSGWAPYRDGYWAWIEPWGWTWVDNAPWGFAPFHYGRWVYVHHRWGWIPGPVRVRPVYAPALVAFIGGPNWSLGINYGASPVGWYPLGPYDIYEPPYRVSRHYFETVNVTNIHNYTVINHTTINKIYNNYAAGKPGAGVRHMYRHEPAAVTAVPRDTFVNARPIARAHKQLKTEDLKRIEVVKQPTASPTKSSRVPQTRTLKPQPPRVRHDVIKRSDPRPPAAPSQMQRKPQPHSQPQSKNSRETSQQSVRRAPVNTPTQRRQIAPASRQDSAPSAHQPARETVSHRTRSAPDTAFASRRSAEPHPSRPDTQGSRSLSPAKTVTVDRSERAPLERTSTRTQHAPAQPVLRESARKPELRAPERQRYTPPAEARREPRPSQSPAKAQTREVRHASPPQTATKAAPKSTPDEAQQRQQVSQERKRGMREDDRKVSAQARDAEPRL